MITIPPFVCIGNGAALSMCFTRYLVVTLADDLIVLYDDGTNGGIRTGKTKSMTSKLKCTLHPLLIYLLLHAGYCNSLSGSVKTRARVLSFFSC